MVIGAAGELPKPPSKPIVFLEGSLVHLFSQLSHNVVSFLDMDDAELAEAVISDIICLNKPYLTSSSSARKTRRSSQVRFIKRLCHSALIAMFQLGEHLLHECIRTSTPRNP
jgi:hypothetical protein